MYQIHTANVLLSKIAKRILLVVLAVSIVGLTTSSSLLAATYYVSPNGDDRNPGTDARPFRTLQKASNLTAPGDTVIAKDGVYTSSSDRVLEIRNAGTPRAYITYISENPHGAILDGKLFNTDYGIVVMYMAAYVRIEGFVIQNFTNIGIYGVGHTALGVTSHDVIISNNHIHHIGNVTISDCTYLSGKAGFGGQPLIYNYTLENNEVDHIGRLSNSCQEHAYKHDHGLYLQGRYFTINNNYLHDFTAGWAIKVDGYWGPEVGANQRSHIISGNKFRPAIRTDPNGGGYIRFYNNLSYSSIYGYMKPPKNMLIDNNSFYKPSGPGSDSPIIVTDDEHSNNFHGTIIKDNVTSSRSVYDTYTIKAVQATITCINNVVNADETAFAPPQPRNIRFIQ